MYDYDEARIYVLICTGGMLNDESAVDNKIEQKLYTSAQSHNFGQAVTTMVAHV